MIQMNPTLIQKITQLIVDDPDVQDATSRYVREMLDEATAPMTEDEKSAIYEDEKNPRYDYVYCLESEFQTNLLLQVATSFVHHRRRE